MTRKFRATLLLLLLGLLPAAAVQAEDNLNFEPIPQQTLLDYLGGKTNFMLLDARSAEEYAAGHIWGASNVPHDSDLAATDVLPEDKTAALVVYCKSGQRAATLQTKLLTAGYSNVRVLAPAQMLWAGELPVFNCGADAPGAPALVTVDAPIVSPGDKL